MTSKFQDAMQRDEWARTITPIIESVVKNYYQPALIDQVVSRATERVIQDMDEFIRRTVHDIARDKLAALVGAKVEAQVRLVVDEA